MTTWNNDEAGGSSNAPQASITGGAIDNTPIGATTASTGRFTTITTTGLATLASLTVTGAFASSSATLTGGTINSMAIGGSTPAAGAFTTLTASGVILGPDGSASAPTFSFSSNPDSGIYINASAIRFTWNSANTVSYNGTDFIIGSASTAPNTALAWNQDAGGDLRLVRDAANVLAQRNSTNAQTSRIYGTFTDASNYERFIVQTVAGGTCVVGTEGAGSGLQRNMRIKATLLILQANGTDVAQFGSTGAAIGVSTAVSSTTALNLPAGTTGVSTLRVAHGSAPSSPVDGDIWTTTAGLFVRINGGTVGPLS